ncbi:hypothetical protein LQW54_007661 [Pestalotiopsis sp. IQ-011]
MCKSSAECRKEASARLLLPVTGEKRKADKGTEEEANKKPKTVVSRFEPCVTCKEVFDIEYNDNEACQTHYEHVHMDVSFFPNDEEVRYSHIDPETDWRREACQEGFVYECCDTSLADNKPCRVQGHFSAADAEKARKEGVDLDDLAERYKEESETSTEDESEIESEPPSESEPSSDTELRIEISSDED